MTLPAQLQSRLSIPAIAAPMFIVSQPELVTETCKAGVIGTFPTLNARSTDILDQWLTKIQGDLDSYSAANPSLPVAPYGCNLIVFRTNERLQEDIDVVVKHKSEVVITSVGHPGSVVEQVHAYGGLVFHDVTTIRHAEKAAEAGVDGIILVAAGAGGHAGTASAFAMIPQIREFWDKTLILSGAMSDGRAVRAAEVLGADMAYMGTRFIATKEAVAAEGYKQMLVDDGAKDIVYTPAISGIPANFLRNSISNSGLDPDNLPEKNEITIATKPKDNSTAWRDIWSAGHGVGSIHDLPSTADLVARMKQEYDEACATPSGVSRAAAE